MATNKNAYIRYQVLDRCFRNTGRRYFIEDLHDACNDALLEQDPNNSGVQRRQIYNDIKFMESEAGGGIELVKAKLGAKTYYHYKDPRFSINGATLNDAEAEQMRSALQVLSRFSGAPQFEWINELIPRLEDDFGLVEREEEVISFATNVDLKGLEHLTPLFHAITNRRVLQVTYQDFQSDAPYNVIYHPYYLKQYNNRWFAFGRNAETDQENWNLALDRIHAIEELPDDYKATSIDWADYFYDIIGVTRLVDGEVQQVELLFTPMAAPYVMSKPLHPSQRHKLTERGLEVTIKVIPNFELTKLLLSFGEQVEVIRPPGVREAVQVRVSAAAERYRAS